MIYTKKKHRSVLLQFYWLLQTCFKNIDIDKLLLQYNTENNTTKRKIIIQKIRVKWKYSILMNEMTYVDELFQQKKIGKSINNPRTCNLKGSTDYKMQMLQILHYNIY